jgi:osmotically-inducible protein OsmY
MSFWTYPDERYYYGWYENRRDEERRTDSVIKSEIVARLRENPYTKPFDVKVDVKGGVVILQGDVASTLVKRAAGDDSWDTEGVVDVSNQLRVASVAA